MLQQDGNTKESEAQVKVVNYDQYLTEDITTGFKNAFKSDNWSDLLKEPFRQVKDLIKKTISPENVFGRLEELDKDQARLRATLGLGSQKADEFRKLVSDGAASFTLMGEGIDKVGETYTDLVKVFKTDVSTTADNLAELMATEKVTGQQVDILAENFRNVGVSIQEVGENMMAVAKVARETGVSVAAVSANVVANLDKMNKYNFENGIKGLAKMSAQASRLGIDMKEIFTVVDKAFNPESAIQMAAAMQRLGVSTTALLDPLRLMDLSQNDPTELQNQLVNMSKDFVRFNKELNQFEIMPGEKRRLNEIGKELGLADGALQKMAINAANLDMKMKQISFPSSLASKEDRELIATLAQVNKQGVAEIKVRQFDAEGKPTGEYDMVEVSKLNANQLQAIKEDQELRGKTMEEIAYDQLDEQKKLNTSVKALTSAIGFGVSTSKPATGIYDTLTTDLRESLFGQTGKNEKISELYETKYYRENINDLTDIDKLGDRVSGLIKSLSDISSEDITRKLSSFGSSIGDVFTDTYDYITNKAKEFGIGGVDTDISPNGNNTVQKTSMSWSDINQKITNENLNQNISKMSFDPLKIEQETKLTMEVKLPPEFGNNSELTSAIKRWFEDQSNVTIVKKELDKLANNNSLT